MRPKANDRSSYVNVPPPMGMRRRATVSLPPAVMARVQDRVNKAVAARKETSFSNELAKCVLLADATEVARGVQVKAAAQAISGAVNELRARLAGAEECRLLGEIAAQAMLLVAVHNLP